MDRVIDTVYVIGMGGMVIICAVCAFTTGIQIGIVNNIFAKIILASIIVAYLVIGYLCVKKCIGVVKNFGRKIGRIMI